MSLEVQLAELTAAIKECTAATLEGNKGRAEALAAAASLKPEPKKPAEKPAETAAPTADAAPVPEKKTRASRKNATPKEISADDIYKAFAEYLDTNDTAERDARREFVLSILNELGADSISEKPGKKAVAAEDRAKAIAWLEAKKRGEEVSFGSDADEPEGDSLL